MRQLLVVLHALCFTDVELLGRYRDLTGDSPDEAGELACDGNADLVVVQLAGAQSSVP
jgi:hypothetical protein